MIAVLHPNKGGIHTLSCLQYPTLLMIKVLYWHWRTFNICETNLFFKMFYIANSSFEYNLKKRSWKNCSLKSFILQHHYENLFLVLLGTFIFRSEQSLVYSSLWEFMEKWSIASAFQQERRGRSICPFLLRSKKETALIYLQLCCARRRFLFCFCFMFTFYLITQISWHFFCYLGSGKGAVSNHAASAMTPHPSRTRRSNRQAPHIRPLWPCAVHTAAFSYGEW